MKFYRANTVGPVLQSYDDSEYSKALANSSWPYGNFQSKLEVCPPQLLLCDWQPQIWHWYRVWAVARATGWLPLLFFGVDGLPVELTECPLCRLPHADIIHVLLHCSGTRDLLHAWWGKSDFLGNAPEQSEWHAIAPHIFQGRICPLENDGDQGASRIEFVGSAVQRLAHAITSERQMSETINQFIAGAADT